MVPFDALPPGAEAQRAVLQFAAFHGMFGDALARRYRWPGGPFADYLGLFAVEGDQLLGQTFVLRLPYRFPSGTRTVAGLAGVTTRPDRLRAGLGFRLVRAVIERERRAGIRHVLLWTNPSWGAYRLYQRLGFRDLYIPSLASKRIHRRPPLPPGWSARRARRNELAALERFHRSRSQGRLGFVDRPQQFLRGEERAGELPLKDVIVLRRKGRLRGYAWGVPNHGGITCGEIAVSDGVALAVAVAALEARAVGSSCVFSGTVVSERPEWFRERAYHVVPADWHRLMGLELGRRGSEAAARRRFGADRPEFQCLGLDRF